MGNILTECQQLRIEQCELCTHIQQDSADAEPRTSPDRGRQVREPPADAAAAQHQRGFNPANMSEAEMLQHALRISRLEAEQAGNLAQPQRRQPRAGHTNGATAASSASDTTGEATALGGAQTERDLVAQAIKASKLEESRERERLREEQAREYQESLLIDQQREAERQRRLQEEEEEKQRKAREAEEAEKAEADRQSQIATLIAESKARLQPEPPADEKGKVQVQVRVPDGRRLRRNFRGSDPVSQLYDFANAEGGEAVASQDYMLVSAMPRKVYEDRTATLEDVGLQGQCALLIEVQD
mmetsp:Transcript_31895/g.74616  ORF Transcript_31895/g.74616 Transcript_31895/m.74616 type:complete len:300 (-) Transcript_31895:21-920(-)|eukprot:CAMPEP_0178396368 /NCGR_PEP_ID=MMETSP0689_2-20121128/13693_1 /TAXON_ID=160604 /ORGANISM="Amphidinium massartii, Strain CS-259" /LENGTH=299 /DNA_ID=CAMNT_0020017041 /DNA_START=21 /DNA_END=920 /DNA_ORIENTATION=-